MAYHGWKNPETYKVALMIDNEQHVHSKRRGWAKDVWEAATADSTFTREERAIGNLAEVIRQYVRENNPLADTVSLYSDLLSAAIEEIDYCEIAKYWLEDVVEIGLEA